MKINHPKILQNKNTLPIHNEYNKLARDELDLDSFKMYLAICIVFVIARLMYFFFWINGQLLIILIALLLENRLLNWLGRCW